MGEKTLMLLLGVAEENSRFFPRARTGGNLAMRTISVTYEQQTKRFLRLSPYSITHIAILIKPN